MHILKKNENFFKWKFFQMKKLKKKFEKNANFWKRMQILKKNENFEKNGNFEKKMNIFKKKWIFSKKKWKFSKNIQILRKNNKNYLLIESVILSALLIASWMEVRVCSLWAREFSISSRLVRAQYSVSILKKKIFRHNIFWLIFFSQKKNNFLFRPFRLCP